MVEPSTEIPFEAKSIRLTELLPPVRVLDGRMTAGERERHRRSKAALSGKILTLQRQDTFPGFHTTTA